MTDSTTRFTDRVSDYSRYRPGYSVDSIEWIVENVPLSTTSNVADIGSGTGIFTEALVQKGCSVIAVEPNDAMRSESDARLQKFNHYSSVAGSAENTTLNSDTVDLVTAAQAFHWFNLKKTKQEFNRILKSNGRILLIWNRRDNTGSEFLSEYEKMLSSFIPEYKNVSHANATDDVISDFLGADMTTAEFSNHQYFNLQGVKGRLLSSSYCPAEGKSGHVELMDELKRLYDKYSNEQGVRFDYCTQVYLGS